MKQTKKRGSAMIVVAFMVTAVAVTVMAGLSLSGSVATDQGDLEKEKKDSYVTQGAVQLATADLINGKIKPGDTKLYFVGDKSVSVAVEDNTIALANSVKLKVNGSGDSKIGSTKVVPYGKAIIDNIWSYGVYSNSSLNMPLGTKVTGSVYVKNNLGLLGLGVKITKDLKTSSSFNPTGLLSILGSIVTGVAAKPMPAIDATAYQNISDVKLTGDQVLTDYKFTSNNSVVFINGDATLNGDIEGDGTIFATGNININNDLKWKGGHCVIVTPGTITFSGSGTIDIEGYFYAGSQVNIASPIKVKGGIASSSVNASNKYEITWDPYLTKTAANGAALHAPAMWP